VNQGNSLTVDNLTPCLSDSEAMCFIPNKIQNSLRCSSWTQSMFRLFRLDPN